MVTHGGLRQGLSRFEVIDLSHVIQAMFRNLNLSLKPHMLCKLQMINAQRK
jgi:hypothetical protein